MTACQRFEGLRKLSTDPAAKILAAAGVKLQTPLEAPASAGVPRVLAELAGKGARLDMLQLLAHALPAREATWWACLSARDLCAGGRPSAAVAAAEAWVMRPGPETRARAREALDAAGDDDAGLCAMAACFADGTLGPGELDDYAAPAGAVGGAVFGMALLSLFDEAADPDRRGAWLLDRALDLARGGAGQVPAPEGGDAPADASQADASPAGASRREVFPTDASGGEVSGEGASQGKGPPADASGGGVPCGVAPAEGRS